MKILTQVSCPDSFGNTEDKAAIEWVYDSRGGFFAVSQNDLWMQLGVGKQGSESWTDEFHVPIGTGTIFPGTIGVRFKNYVAGAVGIVSATLSEKSEPTVGIGSGGISTPTLISIVGTTQNPGDLTLTQAAQDMPGMSATFTINGQNSQIFAILVCDFEITTIGTGLLTGYIVIDGANSGGQAHFSDDGIVGHRATITQIYTLTLAPGIHTIKGGAIKANAGGVAITHATHSRLDLIIKDA